MGMGKRAAVGGCGKILEARGLMRGFRMAMSLPPGTH